MRGNDLITHLGAGSKIGKRNPAQQGNPVLGQRSGVDDTRILQDLLKEIDAAYHPGLGSAGLTITVILTQVALGPALVKVLLHLRILHIHKPVQLRKDLVITFF